MINNLFGKMMCLFGRHQWKAYSANVDGDPYLVTMVWWECPRCGNSVLKCILHNGKAR